MTDAGDIPNHEYYGLVAEAWDVLRGDTSKWPDRPFFLEVIRRYGEPALDVGCGTGRLLIDYLAQGVDIDGVDNSPEMLAICREKAGAAGLSPNLFHQYIEDLNLPRTYRTILIPSSTIQLITDPEKAVQALRRIRACLHDEGVVAASVMAIAPEDGSLISEWETSAVRETDGVTFRRVSWSRYDPDLETEDTRDRYQKIIAGEVVREETHERKSATRNYDQDQARKLFESAGFSRIDLVGGFTFNPVQPDDRLFIVLARK